MAVAGSIMMKHGHRMDGAQWYGKVCTAVTYGAIFLILIIPNMSAQVRDGLIGLCLFMTIAAFAGYALFYARAIKRLTK